MRTLYESIIDSDKTITQKTDAEVRHEAARRWMKLFTVSSHGECKEGDDWSVDDKGNIQIYGNCTGITIGGKISSEIKDLCKLVKIITIEPTAGCVMTIKDPDLAVEMIPNLSVQTIGSNNQRYSFVLVYETSQDLKSIHFPYFVYGSIQIQEAGTVDLRIMPNCEDNIYVIEKKCKKVIYPIGFPTSVKQIKIIK